jgi:nickel-dependent lactate racemase
MEVSIPYGREKKDFIIPDKYFNKIYEPNKVAEVTDPAEEIENAIDNPIGTRPLREIITKESSVAILCDDNTRPTPASLILSGLIPRLIEYGAMRESIKIVMALGTHRPMTEAEIIEKIGRHTYQNFEVINPECEDKTKLINLGRAPDGVEIWANRDAMEGDIRIGIGNIVPHPAVGWSGGGKIIYPGVTGEETVAQFHFQHGLAPMNMFGMDDCPVRLKMEKWVDKVGLDFVVNTVLTPGKKLFKTVAGHFIAAQREGVKYAKELFGKRIGSKSDIAIVSSSPADIDFWQGTKGVLCGDHVLRDGGTLILVTPCYEGVGLHEEYTHQIGNDDAEKVLEKAARGNNYEGDPVALAIGTTISRIRKRICLALVSDGITPEEARIAKFQYYPSIQEAVDRTIKHYTDPSISVITHGGELFLY